jgi:hypothetical protein
MQALYRKWLLLVLLLGCVPMAAAQTAAKPKSKPIVVKKYCHAPGSFCFTFPLSWSVLGQAFDGNGVVVAPPPQPKQERESWDTVTAALVIPPPQSSTEAVTIDQVIEQAVSRVRESGQDFETLERQRRRVDGKPAQVVKLHYVEKPNGREWIEELVFIEGPDAEIYSMALKCAPSSMARMEPVFSRMLGSWTLPEVEPAVGATGEEAPPSKSPADPALSSGTAAPEASTPPKP